MVTVSKVSNTQGAYQGSSASASTGGTGTGYEAKASAAYETWQGTHGSQVGGGGTTVRNTTEYLTATAAAKAGAMTGIEAKANLVEAKDQSGKVTIGLNYTTQLGYDTQAASVKASLLGFGVSAGKEIELTHSLPIMASKLPISVARLASRYITSFHPLRLPHRPLRPSAQTPLLLRSATTHTSINDGPAADGIEFSEDALTPAIQELVAEEQLEQNDASPPPSNTHLPPSAELELDLDDSDPDSLDSTSRNLARIVPASPSYFTGKPHFTDSLLALQELLRKHQTLPTLLPAQAPRVAWRTLPQYRVMVSEPVRASKYHQIVAVLQRLNRIHPALMPAEVLATMAHYRRDVDPFAVVRRPQRVDAEGRSFGNGRRKASSANVYLVEGEGEVRVNGRSLNAAFPRIHDRESAIWALKATGRVDKYNVWAVVRGGGLTGQAESITLAVAKALMVHEPALKPALRRAGCVTRDPRRVERKKTGHVKARKMPAWVKR
ncbi:37S ribosomal protein S9, mitochondrial [Xylographa pallens]|nr:37S ribosomal protein S9, mitochondrial [Xylographa pallens]